MLMLPLRPLTARTGQFLRWLFKCFMPTAAPTRRESSTQTPPRTVTISKITTLCPGWPKTLIATAPKYQLQL